MGAGVETQGTARRRRREWSALESERAGIKCIGESGEEGMPQLRLNKQVGVHWAGQRKCWEGKTGVDERLIALHSVLQLL